MTALDFFRDEQIVVRGIENGAETNFLVQCSRYGELAVHQFKADARYWTITHVPSGLAFSSVGIFGSRTDACDAALEVHTLKNNWREITERDLRTLGTRIGAIFQRFHSRAAPIGIRIHSVESLGSINGYGSDE